jgi:hypothetical protein
MPNRDMHVWCLSWDHAFTSIILSSPFAPIPAHRRYSQPPPDLRKPNDVADNKGALALTPTTAPLAQHARRQQTAS